MLRRVCLVQCQIGSQLTMQENLHIFRQRPEFVVFPEYYTVDPKRPDPAWNAGQSYRMLDYCRTLSDRFDTVLVAGTAVESGNHHFFNTTVIFDRGLEIGRYRKINITQNEMRRGLQGGEEPSLFECDGLRFSVMICADVLDRRNFLRLQPLAPDIIFIPTTSPLRPGETLKEKFNRDRDIFVEGAKLTGAYIVKCCAVGTIWGHPLQGRSLIAAPWGVLSRVAPDEEDRPRIITLVLDIGEIREFRRKMKYLSANIA